VDGYEEFWRNLKTDGDTLFAANGRRPPQQPPSDPERTARFQREAKVIATLSIARQIAEALEDFPRQPVPVVFDHPAYQIAYHARHTANSPRVADAALCVAGAWQ